MCVCVPPASNKCFEEDFWNNPHHVFKVTLQNFIIAAIMIRIDLYASYYHWDLLTLGLVAFVSSTRHCSQDQLQCLGIGI